MVSWCYPDMMKLFSVNHYEEHVASSVITWGTLLLHSNPFVLFFQGLLHLKRTDSFDFLQWLVNTTHCPAEQKKESSPCPIWLACHSHCPDKGSKKAAMLIKTKQISLLNMESDFRRQRSSDRGTVSLILHTSWWLTCFTKFWDMKSSWEAHYLHLENFKSYSYDFNFSQSVYVSRFLWVYLTYNTHGLGFKYG